MSNPIGCDASNAYLAVTTRGKLRSEDVTTIVRADETLAGCSSTLAIVLRAILDRAIGAATYNEGGAKTYRIATPEEVAAAQGNAR